MRQSNPHPPADSAPLSAWLDYIEKLHPQAIELGLERVSRVWRRMGAKLDCAVFTVGGTNGKGSTCAMLAAILKAGGYRVGLYTSPHLTSFNERIQVAGKEAGDAELTRSFSLVEAARVRDDPVALTYFEFTTLAAFAIFASARLDCVVLEVGQGLCS